MTGIEPFLEKAAGSLTTIIYDILKKAGGSLSQFIGDKQAIAKASREYAQKYQNRYGSLKLLGMQQAVPLESVYTAVRFLNDLSIRQFESVEALEQAYRDSLKRRFQTRYCRNQDGITVANENQYLMVLGRPGAGKSTFLRNIGLKALNGKKEDGFKYDCIPVFLELKRFTSNEISIIKSIAEEFHLFGFPLSEEFVTKALEEGKLLILLDGLDEVPKTHVAAVNESIQDFVTQYDKNRFIVSCRVAAYRSSFNRFTDIELADFDDSQIQQFIHQWFQSPLDRDSKTAEKCWEILNHPSNAAAKELAQTPLLLTFLCLVYNRSQSFPDKRGTLYRKALDILLEEWAAEKRIQPGEIYQGLNTELEKVLLSEIAYQGFIADQLFFSQQELTEHIKRFLADTVDKPKYLDGNAVLDAIAIQQGILVERAEDIFSFSHLTIQEYLTAQYISQEPDEIEKLVDEHLTDERWQEVFLLVAGLMRSGEKLLDLMETAVQKYIITPKLHALLAWADRATVGSVANLKSATKRACALALSRSLDFNQALKLFPHGHEVIPNFMITLNIGKTINIAQALNSNFIIDSEPNFAQNKFFLDRTFFAIHVDIATAIHLNIAHEIHVAHKLEQLKIFSNVNFTILIARLEALLARTPDRNEPLEVRQAFVKRVQQTWLSSLQIQQELVELSTEEREALTSYLYTQELIVKCKEAAVRVSRTYWEAMEERLLRVNTSISPS